MLQVIQYDDDNGNKTVAVGDDVEKLMQAANQLHYKEYEEVLTWTFTDNAWSTSYKYGMMYAITSVATV